MSWQWHVYSHQVKPSCYTVLHSSNNFTATHKNLILTCVASGYTFKQILRFLNIGRGFRHISCSSNVPVNLALHTSCYPGLVLLTSLWPYSVRQCFFHVTWCRPDLQIVLNVRRLGWHCLLIFIIVFFNVIERIRTGRAREAIVLPSIYGRMGCAHRPVGRCWCIYMKFQNGLQI